MVSKENHPTLSGQISEEVSCFKAFIFEEILESLPHHMQISVLEMFVSSQMNLAANVLGSMPSNFLLKVF